MDSSPSVQAGSGDGPGKPMPDPASNQAAGEWVPSSPVRKQRPKEKHGCGVPDLVKEALPVQGGTRKAAPAPLIKVLAQMNSNCILPYGRGLLVDGYESDGIAMPMVRKKEVHGLNARAALVDERVGRSLTREEPSITREEPSITREEPSISSSGSKEIYVRVQLGPTLRRSNAEFMFSDGDFHAERNGHLYYKYPSLSTARAACLRVNKGNTFIIKVGVDANWDTPDKENARKEDLARPKKKNRRCEANESAAESGKRKATEADAEDNRDTIAEVVSEEGTGLSAEVAAVDQLIKGEMSIKMDTSCFSWRHIAQFCSVEGNACAARFKFSVAEIFGSVCSSVTMSSSTDIGNVVFPSLIVYMFKAFEQGKSWGGKIGPEDLVIDENGTCAIVSFPSEDATDLNIVNDLTAVVHGLKELYMVDGILPPYYDDLISFLNVIPAGIADDPEILKQVLLQLVNHTCFLPDDKKWGLLQDFYVFFKNLQETAKKKFNEDTAEMANSGWQDMPEIDCLLCGVKKATKVLEDTLADESIYLRHLGVHIMDQVFQIWLQVQRMTQAYDASSQSELKGEPEPLPRFLLKERMMLIAYYFGDFFPKFFRFLFGAMNTQPWIQELCSPFLRKKFEIAAAPFGSVYLSDEGLAKAKIGQ